MDFNETKYEVEFTDDCIEEMEEIYEYISKKLKASEAAKRLMKNVKQNVLVLAESPRLYMKINKHDRLNRVYRKIVIKNYIILYTIDDKKKTVYISHMYYGRQNYLNNIL